jgi:NADP-dependent 3-hydroxy acid dehydrogenase YdfG
MNTNHLEGRVVVVTGAAGGFGRLVCMLASQRGARVVASDIAASGLTELVNTIIDGGGDATSVVADVTDLTAMRSLATETVEQYGALDVMINNAGVMPLAFFSDHEAAAAAWSRCIDINVKGVLHGMIAVYDQMMRQGRGHIVNLSSIYGNFPVVGAAVYGASKAAVNMMSESLRVEAQGRIKVTIIKPTGVPGTGLGGGVINPASIVGILGQNATSYVERLRSGDDTSRDRESISYGALAPADIAEQIIYAIDQPWGVSIGDVTIRAAGDHYIL